MSTKINTFKAALDDVTASSAGGAPFLIGYGTTFLVSAILAFFLPRETAALVVMFQGALALPAAFWLERRMGSKRMEADNPLKELSGYIAMSQGLALPALIVVYSANPGAIPVVMAGLGGVHFLPYVWLQRSKAYLSLGLTLSLGSFALQVLLGGGAFTYILLLVSVSYWVAAFKIYQDAKKLLAAK